MSRIQSVLKAYERFVRLPWQSGLSGRERVWFCIYDPRDERRLRARLDEFEIATRNAGHGWALFDMTYAFEEWLAGHEYRESYFADPGYLAPALDVFLEETCSGLRERLEACSTDTVAGILGTGSLFAISHASSLVDRIADRIKGRLLVFFPGSRDGSNYRLLNARDGWNYLSVPIEAEEKQK